MCSNLHVAVQVDVDHARALLDEDPDLLEAADYDGGTPLHWAAGSNSPDGVKLLLRAGADTEVVNFLGHTPLSVAAQEGHKQTMALLIAAGATVDSVDGANETSPLLISSFNGGVESVRLLLEADASVNVTSELGYTAMALACLQGHVRVVQLLSSYGATRNFRLFEEVPMFLATPMPTMTFAVRPETLGKIDLRKLARAGISQVSTAAAREAAARAGGMFPEPPVIITAEQLATAKGHSDLASWLARSRGFTPLHHLEPLSQDAHQAKSVHHLPAFKGLLRHLIGVQLSDTWELPPMSLLDQALEACPGAYADKVRRQYNEASDRSLPTDILDHAPHPDSLVRRKKVYLCGLQGMCYRAVSAFSAGPQLSDKRAAGLLRSGADINAVAADGSTPLSLAQAIAAAEQAGPGSAVAQVLAACA